MKCGAGVGNEASVGNEADVVDEAAPTFGQGVTLRYAWSWLWGWSRTLGLGWDAYADGRM